MKAFKTIAQYSLIALAAGFIYGCSKDDTTSPIITLTGDNPYTKTISATYAEPGFTATDDEDGDITGQVVVSSGLNPDSTGTYSINYSVSDAAGNVGSESRTVIVQNAAEALKGNYAVAIDCPGSAIYNYSEAINMSATVDNRIIFGKFGDYQNNQNKVYGNVTQVSGTFVNINIPSQTIANIGQPASSRTFSGSGTISVSAGVTTIAMSITETLPGQSPLTCTYTYTK